MIIFANLPKGYLWRKMVVVAQLVRAPDCGSGGRRFEPGLPPKSLTENVRLWLFIVGFLIHLGSSSTIA